MIPAEKTYVQENLTTIMEWACCANVIKTNGVCRSFRLICLAPLIRLHRLRVRCMERASLLPARSGEVGCGPLDGMVRWRRRRNSSTMHRSLVRTIKEGMSHVNDPPRIVCLTLTIGSRPSFPASHQWQICFGRNSSLSRPVRPFRWNTWQWSQYHYLCLRDLRH